jgi:MHS family shikimate/dehydroshikimate transporter-like MFS transporter
MGRRGAAGGRERAENKKAFYSSGVQVGYGVGLLLSTGLVSLISACTTDEQFLSWGWRLPFLFSVVLVLAALWIRNGMAESPNLNSSSANSSCSRRKSGCRWWKRCSAIRARFY